MALSPSAQSAVAGLGSGNPLPASERAFFEPRFGRDLSGIRIHTGSRADTASRAINARAFSLGNDIAFASGQYRPGTHSGRTLMAHEITHAFQGGDGVNRVVRRKCDTAKALRYYAKKDMPHQWSPGLVDRLYDLAGPEYIVAYSVSKASEKVDEHFVQLVCAAQRRIGLEGADVDGMIGDQTIKAFDQWKANEAYNKLWMPVGETGIAYKEEGAGFYDVPLPDTNHIILRQNTTVDVLSKDEKNGWFKVRYGRKVGYVKIANMWLNLPDPESRVYKAKSGDTALKIIQNFYTGEFDEWGGDERYGVNALTLVNSLSVHNGRGRSGIYKPRGDNSSWANAKITAGIYIWLPGLEYLKSIRDVVLKIGGGTGSISRDVWNFVYERGAEFLGFLGGTFHGFLKSIWDAIAGIIEVVWSSLKSLVTGSWKDDLKQIWEALSWENLKKMAAAEVAEWSAKLSSDSPWVRGHAAGYIVGYIISEAVQLFFSGGTLAVVKGGLLATKVGQKIAKGLTKVTAALQKSKTLTAVTKVTKKIGTTVGSARKWASKTLGIDFVRDLTYDGIKKLAELPDSVLNKFKKLTKKQKRDACGCHSPCDVDADEVIQKTNQFTEVNAAKKAADEDVIPDPKPKKETVHSTYPDQNEGIKKALAKTNAKATEFSKEGSPIFQRLKSDGSPRSEWYYIGRDGKQVTIRYREFAPPNISTAIKAPKGGWSKYLENLIGPPPPNMLRAHAHHILYKKGIGRAQQILVDEGQLILKKYGIDPVYGKEVLAWAPNVKGQHILSNLELLLRDLRLADKMGAKSGILTTLKKHGDLAANR